MDPRLPSRLSSLGQRRISLITSDEHDDASVLPHSLSPSARRLSGSTTSMSNSRPKALPTPVTPIHNLHTSAPASPPTPAPSPIPHQRAPSWQSVPEDQDTFLRDARAHFSMLGRAERQRFLAEILNLCDSQQLSFVHHFVSPRLRKDPFEVLPNELCLRVNTNFYLFLEEENIIHLSDRDDEVC
jgi:F-box and WD-40 domain protein CDC4